MLAKKLLTGAANTFQFLRVVVTDVASGGFAGFFEVEYSPDAGATWYPTSSMTTNTAPSPLVASASNELAPFLAWRAFEDSSAGNDLWETNDGFAAGAWVTIDLGAGNGILPNRIRLTHYNVGAGGDYSPTEFKVYGSNTGAFSGEQILLSTHSGLASQTHRVAVTYTI